MKQQILVFSIALNGYQWLYKDCLASHKRYAERCGYVYQAVTRPYATSIGVECCWLKLTLMLEALKAGYDAVLFVDADAKINDCAPTLDHVLVPSKHVYLAKSYTGRFNSGVILAKNTVAVRTWLASIIAARHAPVQHEHYVGWGENGHIIQFTQGCKFIGDLPRAWNNTYDPNLKDYIRHFSFGPLRNSLWLNISHKCLSRITNIISKIHSLQLKNNNLENDKLISLTNYVLKHYAQIGHI